MITKVFRPFWSYDVQETEKWLASMAEQGDKLVAMNRWTRCFYFQKGSPEKASYRIAYDKFQVRSLSERTSEAGWSIAAQDGNWYVAVNDQPAEQITVLPAREGVIHHNKKIRFVFSGIWTYLTAVVLFFTVLMMILMFSGSSGRVVPSPYWIVTYTAFGLGIALWILALYSVIVINKTNRSLMGSPTRRDERQDKRDRGPKPVGPLVIKRKLGWMYAPDKLEKWLEAQEAQGLNLYRVGRTGTSFYFTVGSSRKVSYCASYQTIEDEGYYNIHREAGWDNVYTSNSPLMKWTLWGREYSGAEQPQIFSDKQHQINHAKRIAITHTCMFLPLVLLYVYIIWIHLNEISRQALNTMQIVNIILYVLVILVFGAYSLRSWLYFRRLSKRYRYNL